MPSEFLPESSFSSSRLSRAILHLERKLDSVSPRLSDTHPVQPLLMGIVNITPDSFSDGGAYFSAPQAIGQGRKLWREGADLLDLGAESTRPGFTPVSEEEEWQRLFPVLSALSGDEDGGERILSVDTTKPSIARKSLEAGACLINDIWGLQKDRAMADIVADYGAFVVIMHNRQDVVQDNGPKNDLWEMWQRFFDQSLEIAERAGISRKRIILDPGIGFGKTQEQNRQAVQMLGRLRIYYGLPVLLGLSRKSFFGHFLGRSVAERLPATLAANLYGARQGAALLRVHDVQAHHDALRITRLLEEETHREGA